MKSDLINIAVIISNKMKEFPDLDDPNLYQRGLYDGYLNSIQIILAYGKIDINNFGNK